MMPIVMVGTLFIEGLFLVDSTAKDYPVPMQNMRTRMKDKREWDKTQFADFVQPEWGSEIFALLFCRFRAVGVIRGQQLIYRKS